MRECRVCGCTDENCEECIELTGEPCFWIEELTNEDGPVCSACFRKVLGLKHTIQLENPFNPKPRYIMAGARPDQSFQGILRILVMVPLSAEGEPVLQPQLHRVRLEGGPRNGELFTLRNPENTEVPTLDASGRVCGHYRRQDPPILQEGREVWAWEEME